jgi:ubiquinone/menaquinone biosynthesis C-methylase UbiE
MNKRTYAAKTKYKGEMAGDYDKRRSKRKKWKREMAAVEAIVSGFEAGASIVDVPMGTGRFLPFYTKGRHPVLGLDISMDMLRQAAGRAKKLTNSRVGEKNRINMVIGDAEAIPLPNKSMDYVICIRLLNWVTKPISEKILKEFQRVARKGIIIGFRSLHDMTFGDYIRMGAVDLIPTPRHISRWVKSTLRFARRQGGRIKRGVVNIIAGKEKQSNTPKPGFKGRTLYDEAKMIHFFSEIGMKVCETFPIDRVASYWQKKVDSYSIYSLKFNTF